MSLIPGKKYDFRRERAVRKAGEGLSNARMFLSYFIHPACTRASFSFLEWLPLQTLLATLLVFGGTLTEIPICCAIDRGAYSFPMLPLGNLREIKGRGAIQPAGFLRRSMAFRRRQPSLPPLFVQRQHASSFLISADRVGSPHSQHIYHVGRSADRLLAPFGLIG